jgi:hypothetical protein
MTTFPQARSVMVSRSVMVCALALLMAVLSLPLAGPALASNQSNKNTFRNLGIGSAAVGAYGLLHHNTALGLLGVAGAAYSATRYEKARHAQSLASHRRSEIYHRQSYYHQTVGNYNRGNRRYYLYRGRQYYENLSTGARHRVR